MKLNKDFHPQMAAVRAQLNCDFAIISHIVDQDYTVVAVDGVLDTVKQGDLFEVQNTYCHAVVEGGDTITYNEVGNIKAMVLHPIYTAMQLEAYIGEPLQKNGKVVGTLNFSGFGPKQPPFQEADIALVRSLAREVEAAIEPSSV